MTPILARIVLGLGLSAALLAAVPAVMAQTTTPTTTQAPPPQTPAAGGTPAAAAPADGISMGLPDGLPDQATAAEGQVYLAGTFGAWEERCVKQADGADPCQLYQLLKDQTGNPVSEISIFVLPSGGQAVFGASIMAPLETLLTANLRVAIDQSKAKLYPFSYCTAAGCVAKIGFTADELAVMKKGTVAVVTIVPAVAPDKVVTATITLKGFTAGYQAIADAAAKVKP